MLLGIISALSILVSMAICVGADAFEGFSWLWMLPAGFFGTFLALIILWAVLLLIMGAAADVNKPQKKDNRFYRVVIHWTFDALITLLRVKITVEGKEKIPKKGRFLLVCNHLNDVDPVILMTVFRKSQLAFISKQENDKKFLVGPFLHKVLCQPINRENDREALKTILRCVEILNEDQASVGVFPEGWVSLDHMLHPFRAGVFKIAKKANVPIVVCTLQNTQNVVAAIKRLKSIEVPLHILDMIPAEELKGVSTMEIAERVHSMMAEDLGPEKVFSEESA